MKSKTYVIAKTCSWLFLSASIALCQLPPKPKTQVNDRLVTMTTQALEAIRDKNVNVFISLLGQREFFLGIDSPPIKIARFKEQLLNKKDAYCTIFDSSCMRPADRDAGGTSIRETLLKQPTTFSISNIEGAPGERAVNVKSATSPNDLLFTLIFRNEKGSWVLGQIEYM